MIRIVVDSSADYLPAELAEKNIDLVSLRIDIGENTYTGGVDLIGDAFYETLSSRKEFPKTSQPSPQDFLNIFEDAKKKGDSVVCITLSSALSGTYQSAALAKEIAEYEHIYIIDSLSATIMIRIMADYACNLRQEGASAREIAQTIETLKLRVKVVAALDTLEYLSRGGRISKTAASIGELANVKPIITVTEEGKVSILGKCLGKNKAITFLKKEIKPEIIDANFPVYSIWTYGTENTAKLEEKFVQDGITVEKRLQIGSTIGAHIGPGAFGLVFVQK